MTISPPNRTSQVKTNALIVFLLGSIVAIDLSACGAVVGTNTPVQPLTPQRVAALPAWKAYVENSSRQQKADKDCLRAEMDKAGLSNSAPAPHSASVKGTPLNRPIGWYGTAEARRIADCVTSFQTPAGGWTKHVDFSLHVRAPGESFTSGGASPEVARGRPSADQPERWSYVGTFDNDATTTELRFLAKIISAGGTNTSTWREAFERGINYMLAAQFPSGGWPQVWPLQGGYHDAITYNDGAMLHVVQMLREVSLGQDQFSFVPEALRARAEESWQRGLRCILASQIRVKGRLTIWCQQHDPITLEPASARNYEMPAQCSGESGEIVLFLMQLPDPSSNAVVAVHAAAAWFAKTKIEGKAFKNTGPEGRLLVDQPGGGPLWSRYYGIETDKPIFGDRDRSIHDDVNEISRERRQGYGWFNDTGKRVLTQHAEWSRSHPPIP